MVKKKFDNPIDLDLDLIKPDGTIDCLDKTGLKHHIIFCEHNVSNFEIKLVYAMIHRDHPTFPNISNLKFDDLLFLNNLFTKAFFGHSGTKAQVFAEKHGQKIIKVLVTILYRKLHFKRIKSGKGVLQTDTLLTKDDCDVIDKTYEFRFSKIIENIVHIIRYTSNDNAEERIKYLSKSTNPLELIFVSNIFQYIDFDMLEELSSRNNLAEDSVEYHILICYLKHLVTKVRPSKTSDVDFWICYFMYPRLLDHFDNNFYEQFGSDNLNKLPDDLYANFLPMQDKFGYVDPVSVKNVFSLIDVIIDRSQTDNIWEHNGIGPKLKIISSHIWKVNMEIIEDNKGKSKISNTGINYTYTVPEITYSKCLVAIISMLYSPINGPLSKLANYLRILLMHSKYDDIDDYIPIELKNIVPRDLIYVFTKYVHFNSNMIRNIFSKHVNSVNDISNTDYGGMNQTLNLARVYAGTVIDFSKLKLGPK